MVNCPTRFIQKRVMWNNYVTRIAKLENFNPLKNRRKFNMTKAKEKTVTEIQIEISEEKRKRFLSWAFENYILYGQVFYTTKRGA